MHQHMQHALIFSWWHNLTSPVLISLFLSYNSLVLNFSSFIIYSATILFHKRIVLFFLLLNLSVFIFWINVQQKINQKYFSSQNFCITFAKNILLLSNPDSITNFKFRTFIAWFNFFI